MRPVFWLLICIALLWACVGERSVVAEDADAVDCSVTDPMISAEQIATCRAAAESGNANAQFELGFMYDLDNNDYTEAMKWYRRAAEQGHAKAQIQIGFMYGRGNGVPQDDAAAVAWFRRAAEQGDAEGQRHLGAMYRDGDGVPQDDTEAVGWFRRAAEQGDDGAQYNLGLMYATGRGVPQDYALAHMWFNLAGAGRYNKHTREARDNVAKQMTPAQIAEAQRLAREWTAAHRAEVK